MTLSSQSSSSPARSRGRHVRWRVPREHGFWVMLGAVAATAAARLSMFGPSVPPGPRFASLFARFAHCLAPRPLAALLVFVIAAVAMASLLGRTARRSAAAQLALAALLPLAAVPVDLAGSVPLGTSLRAAFAWAVVFVSGALVVRGVFERAARRSQRAQTLEAMAFALCTATAVALLAAGDASGAYAAMVAAVGGAGIAQCRPSPRSLKAVGLAFTALTVAVGLVMIA